MSRPRDEYREDRIIMKAVVDDTDEDTREAVMDWHYWTERGYQFG